LLGARVLDGNWGAEHMAIAVPKGREAAQALLDSFVSELQSSGQLQQIEIAAGLKGAVNAAKE
jgi:polar amino acid transport system substrate-binding protein